MIEIRDIHKAFDDHIIFENFSLNIDDGEFVIISGTSGCGKTTLLNMIGSIEQPDNGDILVDNKSLFNKKNQREYLKTKVGFLFQNFALIENKTVKQNLDIVKNDCRTNITSDKALDSVGLPMILDKKVYTLSGGEQQRVALARLMIKKCDIILADEPTGSLDKDNAKKVLDILFKLNDEGKTIIIVSHDEKIKNIGKRVVEI